MSEEVEYREDEETGEISFRSVGRFLKKGLLRMLIYVVALCVVVSLVVLPIKFFSNVNPNAVTRIEFVYDGINEGLDPDGGTFDKESIRSATVVAAAIEKAGLNGLTDKVDSVRNLVTVTSIYSKEYYDLREKANAGDQSAASKLIDYRENATRFDVSVAVDKKVGVDKNAAVKLAEAIVTCYKEWFASRYAKVNIYSTSDFERKTEKPSDYLREYDRYAVKVTEMLNYMDELAKKDSGFRTTTGKSFADLKSELTQADRAFTEFKSFVMSNKVTRNAKLTQNNIDSNLQRFTAESSSLESTITALQDQIMNFKPNSTSTSNGGGTTTSETYTQEYYDLQRKLTDTILAKGENDVAAAEYTARKTAFADAADMEDSNTLLQAADTLLVDALNEATVLVGKINTAVNEYYTTRLLANPIRVTQSAVYVRDTLDVPLLYIYLATVAVGIIVALIVTQVKIKQAEKKNAEKAEKAEKEISSDK